MSPASTQPIALRFVNKQSTLSQGSTKSRSSNAPNNNINELSKLIHAGHFEIEDPIMQEFFKKNFASLTLKTENKFLTSCDQNTLFFESISMLAYAKYGTTINNSDKIKFQHQRADLVIAICDFMSTNSNSSTITNKVQLLQKYAEKVKNNTMQGNFPIPRVPVPYIKTYPANPCLIRMTKNGIKGYFIKYGSIFISIGWSKLNPEYNDVGSGAFGIVRQAVGGSIPFVKKKAKDYSAYAAHRLAELQAQFAEALSRHPNAELANRVHVNFIQKYTRRYLGQIGTSRPYLESLAVTFFTHPTFLEALSLTIFIHENGGYGLDNKPDNYLRDETNKLHRIDLDFDFFAKSLKYPATFGNNREFIGGNSDVHRNFIKRFLGQQNTTNPFTKEDFYRAQSLAGLGINYLSYETLDGFDRLEAEQDVPTLKRAYLKNELDLSLPNELKFNDGELCRDKYIEFLLAWYVNDQPGDIETIKEFILYYNRSI